MTKMIFVSFDEIGWYCLKAFVDNKANVASIVTLEDAKREKMSGGRSFDDISNLHKIPILKVNNINEENVLNHIRNLEPDVIFVIGWSQLVNKEFIGIAKYACIGMHPTLLPKHRGRAPIPWAIILGLKKTGVTMFHIEEGPDCGDIIAQLEIPIEFEDDAKTLYEKCLSAHIKIIGSVLPLLQARNAPRIKQDEIRASYWPKRTPSDGIIDWNTSERNLYDWIRALTEPYPGAFTYHNNRKLTIWKSRTPDGRSTGTTPGRILKVDEAGIVVAAGEGSIVVTDLHLDGHGRLQGREIQRSNLFNEGDLFG